MFAVVSCVFYVSLYVSIMGAFGGLGIMLMGCLPGSARIGDGLMDTLRVVIKTAKITTVITVALFAVLMVDLAIPFLGR
jgi:hypothetical protein